MLSLTGDGGRFAGLLPRKIAPESCNDSVAQSILSSQQTVLPVDAHQEVSNGNQECNRENAGVGTCSKRLNDRLAKLPTNAENGQYPDQFTSLKGEEDLRKTLPTPAKTQEGTTQG